MAKLEWVVNTLRDGIRAGKYPAGGKFPSEHELSERHHANRTTINKAVSILIQEGYLARGASTRAGTFVKSGTPFPRGVIGCLVNFRDSFSADIVRGAMKTAFHRKHLLSPFDPEVDEITETISCMERAGFKGILSMHYGILNTSLPTVYIDDDNTGTTRSPTMCVFNDNLNGGRLIAEKLLENGHRDIALVFTTRGENFMDSPRNRGMVEALKEKGVMDVEARCFTYSEYSTHLSLQTFKRILARYPLVTAIACNTDHAAFNMIQSGRQLGLDIPGKISISGYGNVKSIRDVYNLLTVDQHPFDLGQRACEKLIELLEGGSHYPLSPETLAVELIDGTSVKPIYR